MRPTVLGFAALFLLASIAPARAGGCGGDPGWVLDLPDSAEIGSELDVCMQGPAGEMGLFMASLGQGPIGSVYGDICLDFPLLLRFPFLFDGEGRACFTAQVPCDPAAIDVTIYAQFITCKPNRGISNQDSLLITEGICVGDFATYSQLDFGGECEEGHEKAPACRRDEWFDALFPNGLVVGDQDGGKEDGFYALTFTSAAAIAAFLPANDGAAENLDGDATDPTSSNSGDVVGQIAAARLNVALDDAGVFDDVKARTDVKLGDLVFVANVNPDLFGWSVRDLVDLADLAISGALGDGDMDIDGDGDLDATLGDLSDALKALNQNFNNGTVNRGTVDFP